MVATFSMLWVANMCVRFHEKERSQDGFLFKLFAAFYAEFFLLRLGTLENESLDFWVHFKTKLKTKLSSIFNENPNQRHFSPQNLSPKFPPLHLCQKKLQNPTLLFHSHIFPKPNKNSYLKKLILHQRHHQARSSSNSNRTENRILDTEHSFCAHEFPQHRKKIFFSSVLNQCL